MKKYFLLLSVFMMLQNFTYAMPEVPYKMLKERDGYTYLGENLYTGKATDGKNRSYFLNGKATGTWIFFYKNGNIKSIEQWKEGRLDGKYILYLEDGTKNMETHYHLGKDNGSYTLYYPNGNIRVKGEYEDGKPKGLWEYYTLEGKLKGKAKGNL